MKRLRSLPAVLLFAAVASLLVGLASPPQELERIDDYTLRAPFHLVSGRPATNPDGTINVVVEIPAGTNAKWEVGEDGLLRWEFKNGRPRVVQYLPYPGNYGMVPRTLQAEEEGGDGDPLDVLILGAALPRGSVVPAKVIGVLRILDGGERDDKLLAVMDESPLDVKDLDELDEKFQGVSAIVETWFANYKGPGKMEVEGFSGAKKAREIVASAARAYEAHESSSKAGR